MQSERNFHLFWQKCKQYSQVVNYLSSTVFSCHPTVTLTNIYPNELKTYVHTKNLHTSVYSSFYSYLSKTRSSQDVLQVKWINLVYPYSELLFSKKREMSYKATKKMWRNSKCILLSTKNSLKNLYEFNYIEFWKRRNYIDKI